MVDSFRTAESIASFHIGGVNYSEILKLRVHRDLSELSGEGEVTLSWPGAAAGGTKMLMPAFMDGSNGSIHLDGQLAMTFRFDTRTSHGSPSQYELELHFRGLSGDWVDGSPDHDTGQENDQSPGSIVQKLAKGYAAQAIDESGGASKLTRFIIAQGETVERAARRATREFGINMMENEQGQVVLYKAKSAMGGGGGNLFLGDKKITHWSVMRDIVPRGSEFRVFGNAVPVDELYGKAAEIMSGFSTVPLGFNKIKSYLADSDHDKGGVKDRSGYEGAVSSAQGLNVTLRVSTWTDVDGVLWTLRRNYPVRIPIDGVDEELMLTAVTFILTPTERYATLVLTSQNGRGFVQSAIPTGANSMTEEFTTTPGPPPKDEDKEKQERGDPNAPE